MARSRDMFKGGALGVRRKLACCTLRASQHMEGAPEERTRWFEK